MPVAASFVVGEDLFSEQELMHEEMPTSNLHASVLERHLSSTSHYWISDEYTRRYQAWCDQVEAAFCETSQSFEQRGADKRFDGE